MGMHSHRRLEVSRQTDSTSTTCLVMSGNGLKIAGTTTISGAPTDGTAWQNGNCGRRVMRGGAYSLIPALVRSPVCLGSKSSARDHSGGFRGPEQLNDGVVSPLFFPNV